MTQWKLVFPVEYVKSQIKVDHSIFRLNVARKIHYFKKFFTC